MIADEDHQDFTALDRAGVHILINKSMLAKADRQEAVHMLENALKELKQS